jgi:hypothetical protein
VIAAAGKNQLNQRREEQATHLKERNEIVP